MVCLADRRTRPVPARAGDREGSLRQARIGLAIPGKAIGKHCYLQHLPVPFAAQDRARPKLVGMSA